MATTFPLILGGTYFIALAALGVYTSTLRLWLPYVAGCVVFVMVLVTGMNWSVSGEDGPSGFAVIAVHGSILWLAILAHAIRWLWVSISALRRLVAARRK